MSVKRKRKHERAIDIEKLIKAVHERNCLWDCSCDTYKKTEHKVQIWAEVGEICGSNGWAVKKKWKYLRDNFRAEFLKLYGTETAGPQVIDSTKTSPWRWFNNLLFLKDFLCGFRKETTTKPENVTCKVEIACGEYETNYYESPVDLLPKNKVEDPLENSNSILSMPQLVPLSHPLAEGCSKERLCPETINDYIVQEGKNEAIDEYIAHSEGETTQNTINKRRKHLIEPIEEYNQHEQLKPTETIISRPEEQDTTYHFLMSLRDPLNSLPNYSQMFLRLKFQELLFREIQRHSMDDKI